MKFYKLKTAIFACTLLFCTCQLFARGKADANKTGAGKAEANKVEASQTADKWEILAGTDEGLIRINRQGKVPLWQGGAVKKIIHTPNGLLILTNEGIFASDDLKVWEGRSRGLPEKTIKVYQDGKKTFLYTIKEIKDLEINPANPDILACATNDQVYLSFDQGRAWSSLGRLPYNGNGIKAVAVVHLPAASGRANERGNTLTVFAAHSIYGIHYLQPEIPGSKWTELNKGIEKLETTDNPDEVSDIAALIREDGSLEIYASQTFRARIYRLNWALKSYELLWTDGQPFGTSDSLDMGKTGIRFIQEGEIAEIAYPETGGTLGGANLRYAQQQAALMEIIRSTAAGIRQPLNCISMQENREDSEPIVLSELWLLEETKPQAAKTAAKSPRIEKTSASGKEGLYLPVNHAMDAASLKPYLGAIDNSGLNLIVIDMKDDYGRLRFTPNNPELAKKGRVFRPLDIEAFLSNMKARGIYTVARIVVFKDPVLAARDGNKYAVWDAANNKPWAGYEDYRRKKSDISEADRRNDLLEFRAADDPEYEIARSYYDERWVDPYSEEVWEYTAGLAAELHERGFDEIQFDYIRFPTDGINLGNARYRWRENGMDMESAILSFLRHVRARIKAPISIDIYGANGWYRTGARTGQEVELLAPWIDVICPMYYPSHFEQYFLAQAPAELRPYRIYYQGVLRTSRISRGSIIVRPYAQAFYLNVSYDRKYYNNDYVRLQLDGVRDAGSGGLIYWNNSGRYDDLPAKSW
jgi:hypothetical protein